MIAWYLAPLQPIGLRDGRLRLAAPHLQFFRKAEGERVTVLKMNRVTPRWALVRYEAQAHRVALADTHPLVLRLPTDRDGRMSTWARMALAKVGLPLGSRSSIRDIAPLMLAQQVGAAHLIDAQPPRGPIILAHEGI